jgi:hypothetical protein
MTRTSALSACLPLLLGVACARGQGEKVRDARMAQIDAQAEVETKAIEEQSAARASGVDARFQAEQQAVQNANPPGEGATEDLVKIAEQRAKYKSDAQARLDKLNVRLRAEQQKIEVLGGRAPSSLQRTWQTASTEHNALLQDVSKLDQVTPDRWAATKDQLESRISSLDDRIKSLNDAIDDV